MTAPSLRFPWPLAACPSGFPWPCSSAVAPCPCMPTVCNTWLLPNNQPRGRGYRKGAQERRSASLVGRRDAIAGGQGK